MDDNEFESLKMQFEEKVKELEGQGLSPNEIIESTSLASISKKFAGLSTKDPYRVKFDALLDDLLFKSPGE